MIERTLTLPELGLIAGTRVALGAGVGFLLAPRLSDEQRRAVGWTLLAVGALTTIPLAASVFLRRDGSSAGPRQFPARWQRAEGLVASRG
jgi:hypothetical protein